MHEDGVFSCQLLCINSHRGSWHGVAIVREGNDAAPDSSTQIATTQLSDQSYFSSSIGHYKRQAVDAVFKRFDLLFVEIYRSNSLHV